MFNTAAELIIPTGTPTNEANQEIKTQPLTTETKIRRFSKQLKVLLTFFCFSLLNHYVLFLRKHNFLFDLSFYSKVMACHICF